jgi:hypothetical protein
MLVRFYILIKKYDKIFLETIDPNESKWDLNGLWLVHCQNCVRQHCLAAKVATVTKNRNFFD